MRACQNVSSFDACDNATTLFQANSKAAMDKTHTARFLVVHLLGRGSPQRDLFLEDPLKNTQRDPDCSIHMYIHIYIYIYRERERWIERERERDR